MNSVMDIPLSDVSFNFLYVKRGDTKVFLPQVQMALFAVLMKNFQEVVPRDQLIETMPESPSDECALNKLRVHLKRLREKLELINLKLLSEYKTGYLICDNKKEDIYKRVLCRHYEYMKKLKQEKERGNENEKLQSKREKTAGLGSSKN